MISSILADSELRRYAHQISLDEIGLKGQELLKQSEITISGLGGIGIAAMHGLLSAGLGCVRIIDDTVVTEDSLPEQTLFSLEDVGKMRCIAARDKKIIYDYNASSINLYGTKLKKHNAADLMGNSKILIETVYAGLIDNDILDYADQYGIDIIGGFCMLNRGIFGMYSEKRKTEFRDLLDKIHLKISTGYYGSPFCFCSIANFIGGLLAARVIKILLGHAEKDSELYEIEAKNFKCHKLL